LILGRGFVLTFLEDSGDVFEPVRVRMRSGRGRLRKEGADYLAYALVDAIVDHYFEVLEALGDDIEAVEEEVVEVPTQETLRTIHVLKRELIYLRRAVWPLREAVNSLLRDDSELVTDATRVFLRDLYDHAVHVLDSVETLRDIVSGMLDVYLSSASNRMNQVMKVLTVMSSIFIPLTFIAGVYGMNFEQMPELKTSWGYPAVLLLMVAIAGGQLLMFRRKGWI
jgi:magnesium transporter